MEMTYEERLQQTAQLHADKWNRLCIDADAGWQDADCLGDAEVTIAAQAEAIRDVLKSAVDLGIFTTEGLSDPPETNYDRIDKYLLDNGYVPKL